MFSPKESTIVKQHAWIIDLWGKKSDVTSTALKCWRKLWGSFSNTLLGSGSLQDFSMCAGEFVSVYEEQFAEWDVAWSFTIGKMVGRDSRKTATTVWELNPYQTFNFPLAKNRSVQNLKPRSFQTSTAEAVLTCFFLDTAKNVFLYIRTIADIVRPGGLWANLGP